VKNSTIDFLIVGQGLAGTVLSHLLIEKGLSVKVIENFKANSATRIAAGVFNPVTYRKLKMAEFADFLIPEMFDYYPKMEEKLGANLFRPTSFLKILTDIEELNNWQVQSVDCNNKAFMSQEIFSDDFEGTLKIPFGAGQVKQSGVVKLSKMLDLWKEFLLSNDLFIDELFDYDKLIIEAEFVSYGNIQAKKIVFCEGVGISNNPWFNWLPMQQFKGEVLEISSPKLKLTRMVNRGVFVLPLENGNFKIGATHDWKNVDEEITKEGKKELTDKIDNILNVPYQVIDHQAGLRPASRDRHPYIGVHPKHRNLYVMNGLGSKGVIMAPWLGKAFIDGIDAKEWPKGFDINRYLRFYNEQL
jgi:glycine/D-amino acid oxidase-like deaminating enzyme